MYTEIISDEYLWLSLKKGDRMALQSLYNKYVHVLYSYGKKLTPNSALVEDAIQDLFIDLWDMRERLSPVETARFYLLSSLRRRIYKAVKVDSDTKEEWIFTDESLLPSIFSEEDKIIEKETFQFREYQLQQMLRGLPKRQYEALLLRYYQGLSYPEIAQILTITEQSSRNLVQKGLQTLRNLIVAFLAPIVYFLVKNIFL